MISKSLHCLSYVLLAFFTLQFIAPLEAQEKKMPRFWDSVGKNYVYICSEENGVQMVAESCGRFWDKTPRKRAELIEMLDEYKGVKKNDYVMGVSTRNAKAVWILAPVGQLYEDGSVELLEYYDGRGYNPGTRAKMNAFAQLSLGVSEKHGLKAGSEVCAKEKITIVQGFNDEQTYSIEAGERVELKHVFANGYGAITYKSVLRKILNLAAYGTSNKLPVPLQKLEICPEDIKAGCQ